jgi:hypothetical protein
MPRLEQRSTGDNEKWSGRWESNISLGYPKHLIIMALLANKFAARDFCVKNDATPANAGQCEHWSWVTGKERRLGSHRGLEAVRAFMSLTTSSVPSAQSVSPPYEGVI